MMRHFDKEKKIGLIIIIMWILGLSLFIGFQLNQKQTKAVGGGFLAGNNVQRSSNATIQTVGFGAGTLPFEIDGYYILVMTTSFSPSINVSSIADTVGNTYNKIIQSNKYEDTEIWYANYTKTNFAANTITITYSEHTKSNIAFSFLSGVTTGAIQSLKNNGTATTLTVPSFTPNLNFACADFSGVASGSTTTVYTAPGLFYLPAGSIAVANNGATTFWSVNTFNNIWTSNLGATTIPITFTPSASPKWDDVVACFPEGPVTTTTSTTTITPTTTTTTLNKTTTTTFSNTTSTTTTTTKTTTNATTTATTTNSTRTINSTATTTSTSTNTITSTTTNQLIPQNGDFTLIGFIGLMAILFSILTFWMPSYGHYQIETKDLDYKTDLESMFGVGRIFTKIRLVLFPGMAAGMWFILAVLAIVLLPQDSTGAGGSFRSQLEDCYSVYLAWLSS